MRLIDADALIEKSKKFLMDRALIEIFETLIDDTPTAYEVEKVVAELEKEKAKSIYDSDSVIDVKSAYSKAIDILRKGGVE